VFVRSSNDEALAVQVLRQELGSEMRDLARHDFGGQKLAEFGRNDADLCASPQQQIDLA
jgi:hypothetical protein